MANNRNNIISRNLPPIIIGGLVSIIAHWSLLYLTSALFNDEVDLSDLTINLIAFFIPSMVGAFVAGYFFKKSKLTHTILTALIFFIGALFPELSHFFRNVGKPPGGVFILLIILFILSGSMTGGFIGIRMKKKKIIS